MKKIVRLSETDLHRIVKRVIKESSMPSDFDHLSDDEFDEYMSGEINKMRNINPDDWSDTYSWYDPRGEEHPYGGRYKSQGGHWDEHNNPDYSSDWEDYEFDDFTELKRSNIPNERYRQLRTRRDFDALRNPETGKVHIRKNPSLVKKYYRGN